VNSRRPRSLRPRPATWAFATALFATNLRAGLALRTAFVLQALFMVLNNLVFFVFWWVLLRRVPEVRGWRLADLEVLFGTTATSFGLVVAVTGGVRHLARAIDDGELDTLLTQPKPTLLYALGMRSSASGFGDVISGIGFLILSGHVTVTNSPLVAFVVAGGAATLLASGIVFFSLPFWLSRTETVSRQLWDLLVTFSLYPEPLFGGALRLLLFTVLPAGFVSYLPVAILRQPSAPAIVMFAAGAAAYLSIAAWTFGRGLRRYASGSRFVAFG
jgi:viologen exporter family transport system permease protein